MLVRKRKLKIDESKSEKGRLVSTLWSKILNSGSNVNDNSRSFANHLMEARFIDSMHQSPHFHLNLFKFHRNLGFSYNLHVI